MVASVGPKQTLSVTHSLFPVFPHTEDGVNLCLYDAPRLSYYLTRQLAPNSVRFLSKWILEKPWL